MPYPETATGFMIEDQKKWQDFKKQEFKLKPFEDRDVDIAIDCCGVCASDVHTIHGGWGECPLPICVGHEIVGKAVKVGKDVKTIKVGDRVGVGAQVQADLTCNNCKADQENYCPNCIDTFGAKYKDGTISQGGYSSHVRAHEYFTFKIPEGLESEIAAPMLCAGITGKLYSVLPSIFRIADKCAAQSTALSCVSEQAQGRKLPLSVSEAWATSPSCSPKRSVPKSTSFPTHQTRRMMH
jgi:D-arabinose 1-dehydrogenase-like Zn-dependent alcohol dehydrogenase